ncbi:hypothetical protein [Pedobacter ginsengisoli]|uniref:hypothetical protein n=1 Tax=Pedobacter ginsengisoli TaxID=363852 RepID=UPI00254E004C|nr:hypothetical protein [Pedobacter ginsengisoli]
MCKRIMCSLAFFFSCASYTLAQTASPYILTVGSKPYLLRSYLMFEGKKRTHVISVGTPEKVSYSYDLKQGALLQVWRGQFIDVTEMWKDRGEPQLAKPLGNVLPLSAAPAIATLADKDAAWPDSIAFDDFQNKAYVLDKNRMPTFLYSSNGADVSDKIAVRSDGASIDRTISVSNSKGLLYCRLAAAPVIKAAEDNIYSVGNKAYSVKVPADAKAFIRTTKNGQELLAPLAKGTASLTYSLIW